MGKTFPEKLRSLREGRKPSLSRKALSELCGLPSGAIRKYERGEAKPGMDSLVAIAEFFQISIDELVGKK